MLEVFYLYRMIYMYYMFIRLHMSNDMSLRALFFWLRCFRLKMFLKSIELVGGDDHH